jgi:tRNA(Leu) C34 or U34 (ribose-2'-O)-methylase TrmL
VSGGFAVVALDRPKNIINVGGVLRIAYNFGVSLVVTSGLRYRHASTDTPKGVCHIPFLANIPDIFDAIPYDCVPVAVDILPGATPLPEYAHPKRAFYVFGAEDATLDERVLGRCRDVVYVPTNRCMNLAVSVGVVLYDRMAKGGPCG